MQHIPRKSTTKPFIATLKTTVVTLIFLTSAAWAGTLEELRASGAIGESFTGYTVARDASVQAQVDAINAQRKAIYQKKAAAQGVSIDQVGQVYAKEIFNTVPAGTWIHVNGNWVKK
ncbi:MAG: DUF1318 domain-containing protein [Nitrosomonas sp.]|nr:MAG: DUF1318 domain-containing protein [Nitrosomonas sp.]